MKKSIFKRVISAALALTMLASMAVGMSTSVSAAAAIVPEAPNITLSRRYVSGGKYCMTIEWEKVKYATKYRVAYCETAIINGEEKLNYQYEKTISGTSYTFDNLSVKNGELENSKYDISVTSMNGDFPGKTAHLYSCRDFYRVHVPCMDYVKKDSVRYSTKNNSVTLSWDYKNVNCIGDNGDNAVEITLKNKATNKEYKRTTRSKSYTFKNLPKGTYNVSFRSYVMGYLGTMIKDTDIVRLNTNIVVK